MDTLEFNDPLDIRAYLNTHYPSAKIGELTLILSPLELRLLKTDEDRIREERYRSGDTDPEAGLYTFPRLDTDD